MQQISIAELIINIGGFGLEEDLGCGSCVERLTNALDELIETLHDTSTNITSLVNQTQILMLEEDIAESEVSAVENNHSEYRTNHGGRGLGGGGGGGKSSIVSLVSLKF